MSVETKRGFSKQAVISQQNRLIKLDTPLGPDILLPQRVVANERLGRGYQYQVDVISLHANLAPKELIAQPVTLWLRQSDCRYLPVHGYVNTIRRLGSDGQFAVFQLSFASWDHFLKFRSDARIWQDKSVDDILSDVFNGHPQARGNFRFDLTRPSSARSYCTQYETDWNFSQRLMEEEGWFGYYEQDADGSRHALVITDSVGTLKCMSAKEILFHGAGTGDEIDRIVEWSGTSSLFPRNLSTRTFDYKAPRYDKSRDASVLTEHCHIPPHLEIYEYTGAYTYAQDDLGDRQARIRVEGWESRSARFFGVSGTRTLPLGTWFSLINHPEHSRETADDREFVVIGVEWFIENNLPLSKPVRDFHGSLKDELNVFRAGISTAPQPNDENTGCCFNRFEVQRRKIEFRSPFEHSKPVMHTQTAIVVGPAGEEIHTDNLNRVKIQFHWDRHKNGIESASCWVRVSYPNAGQEWGALSVPRVGQEVIVTFLGGESDRPVITGRLYNAEQTPQWHSDGKLSGYKSKEYQGVGFNQLVLDDNTNQNRVHLYCSNTNAQLNLGYLVSQQGNCRKNFYGSGFSLRTDDYGAVIANKGLYLTTFGHPGAEGTQLDALEAHQQLQAASTLSKALSDAAVTAGANALVGQEALSKFADATCDNYVGRDQEQANRFKEPVMVAASPAGIGLASPQSIHVHAGDIVTLSSGADTNLAVGKILAVSAGEKISMFAQNDGMKLFAAKGKVEMQAQNDDIEIIAEKVLRLLSTTDRIEIAAKTEILLSAGGSFIKINASGITEGTGGAWTAKASKHDMTGPTTLAREMNTWEKTEFDEEFVARHQGNGKPIANRHFEITREDGSILRGTTNADGKTGIQKSQLMGEISLKFLGAVKR